MAGKLAGKVAVVTASTEGIGYAIARRLAQDGAKVMLSSRKEKNVQSAVAELKKENLDVEGLVCHVAKKEDRQKLLNETLKRFGGVDVLVSNAAASTYFGATLDTPEEAYDKMFDINVKSSFYLCTEFVPAMEKRGGGTIILISSIGGYTPVPLIGVYSITKTALFGMIKALAPELAERNIRINGIAPGLIETKFSAALLANEDSRKLAVRGIPLGRVGQPHDISGAASFLASSDSDFMTGETIVVSGGQSGRL